MTKMTKIIIWGHKLHSHTHSYIHGAFFKAFKSMGYDTHWLDNSDHIDVSSFKDCLFITEGQCDNSIPLDKTNRYILHNCDITKYADFKYLSIQVYTNAVKNLLGINEAEIKNCTYYHNNQKTLYQPWATDLLPDEIDCNLHFNNNSSHIINWVGTLGGGVHGNDTELNPFIQKCNQNNVFFIHHDPWSIPKSFNENVSLIRESYLAPSIVGKWQKDNGYIPCRIFKNISYGKMGITNSKAVKELFGDYVVYSEDTSCLYDFAANEDKLISHKKMKESMEYVKNNHTYLNRIQKILQYI
jgi:hypothetical protein